MGEVPHEPKGLRGDVSTRFTTSHVIERASIQKGTLRAPSGPLGRTSSLPASSADWMETTGLPQSPVAGNRAQGALNVLSSSCAHLGLLSAWLVGRTASSSARATGNIYDINGLTSVVPPRLMYRYALRCGDGYIYVKHRFDAGGEKGSQAPYVV